MAGFWRQPLVIAAYRAIVGALVLAGAAYFGVLQSGGSQHAALIAAGVAFFGYLVTRGATEGLIDQLKA